MGDFRDFGARGKLNIKKSSNIMLGCSWICGVCTGEELGGKCLGISRGGGLCANLVCWRICCCAGVSVAVPDRDHVWVLVWNV